MVNLKFPFEPELVGTRELVKFPIEFPNPYRDLGIWELHTNRARNLRELGGWNGQRND